jgi:hypothetical protein
MKQLFVVLGVFAIILSGCTIKMADLTVVSIQSNNIPAKSIGTRVTGEHCVLSWLGINWFGGEPNLKEAIDQAMIKAGPEYDALVEASIVRKNGYWNNCYEVTGTAISTK